MTDYPRPDPSPDPSPDPGPDPPTHHPTPGDVVDLSTHSAEALSDLAREVTRRVDALRVDLRRIRTEIRSREPAPGGHEGWTTEHVLWSEVADLFPLAESNWECQVGDAGDALSLVLSTCSARRSTDQALTQYSIGDPYRGSALTPSGVDVVGGIQGAWLVGADPRCQILGVPNEDAHAIGCACRRYVPRARRWDRVSQVGIPINLKPGTSIVGTLRGRGPDVTFHHRASDPSSVGGPREVIVHTWILDRPRRAPLQLLGSHDLNSQFTALVGRRIRVERLPDDRSIQGRIRNQHAIYPLADAERPRDPSGGGDDPDPDPASSPTDLTPIHSEP